jgi:Flp pilus assembly CpaE family ATPase
LIKPATRIRVTDVVAFFAHSTVDTTKHDRDPVLRALSRATARCQKEFRKVTVADIAKLAKAEGGRIAGRKRVKELGAGAVR